MPSQQTNLWGKADDMSREALVKRVMKRNGTIVSFDFNKIVRAIDKAMRAAQEGSLSEAEKVAEAVFDDVASISARYRTFIPTVEGVQDTIERQLMLAQYVPTAKAFIIYREKRAKLREVGAEV